MGKKRIVTTKGDTAQSSAVVTKRKKAKHQLVKGVISIYSTYNNTIVSISTLKGDVVVSSSAGTMGFKGTKKSTPYAATLVAKDAIDKARELGLQEANVSVRGVGPGREGALRGIASTGISILSIADNTPQPHNGVKPSKPRRV